MAESTSAALGPRPFQASADIARAEKLVRERFLHEGEDPAVALAPGTPRRRALDLALGELDEDPKAQASRRPPGGASSRCCSASNACSPRRSPSSPTAPCSPPTRSTRCRARSPRCSPRRSARAGGNGRAAGSASPELLASADDPRARRGTRAENGSAEPERARGRGRGGGRGRRGRGRARGGRRRRGRRGPRARPARRARGGRRGRGRGARGRRSRPSEDDDEPRSRARQEAESRRRSPATGSKARTRRTLAEQPEDPNAAKRFWFEHATGAGKTVAALGFVEASQTGGVLILTHRRNLVDQFHGELRDRGYAKRISRPLLEGRGLRQRAPSRSRPTSGSCATPARSRAPTRSSSATRPTPRSARRRAPRSATGPGRSSSA